MKVTVTLPSRERAYDIELQPGLLEKIPSLLAQSGKSGGKLAMVSDSHVFPLYGEKLAQGLREAGFAVSVTVLPAGERTKNLRSIEKLYTAWSLADITRGDAVLALGGGVIGDLCGFAAATYLRGVAFYQVPTTLLAQVDSSVGGKTGVDLPSGKNRAGAFYQPEAVYIDPLALETLPKRQLACGMAEVIKYAAIFSEELFRKLEERNKKDSLEEIIAQCCAFKRDVVQRDELDKGERMLLNFGHTIGHAIEKQYAYKKYTHGEAISAGMVMITEISEKLGVTEAGTAQRLQRLLKKYGLPAALPLSREKLAQDLLTDKKRDKNTLRVVLLDTIGRSGLHTMTAEEFVRLVNEA